MNDKEATRTGGAPDDETAAVTGVATGNLGTGANLEDTQVLRTLDLAEPEVEEPGARASFVAEGAAPRAEESVVGAVELKEPEAAAHAVRPVVGRRRSGRASDPARGLAGLLAAVLVVLASVAVLTMGGDGSAGVGQGVPSAVDPTGPAATDVVADQDGKQGGKCRRDGNGNGNGNKKCPDPDGDEDD